MFHPWNVEPRRQGQLVFGSGAADAAAAAAAAHAADAAHAAHAAEADAYSSSNKDSRHNFSDQSKFWGRRKLICLRDGFCPLPAFLPVCRTGPNSSLPNCQPAHFTPTFPLSF